MDALLLILNAILIISLSSFYIIYISQNQISDIVPPQDEDDIDEGPDDQVR